MTDKVKRRLTTVLCADVHGYSRLMEADETGTLEKLRRCRAAMARLVERHDGRIVNTWGDAVITEFPSVVEAVQCAVEIQQEVSNQDSDPASAPGMRFRIGVNLGDVMVDGADIYGDGVNIAARLQEIAEPGGIVVSNSVYDQVYNKLSIGFDCLGQQPMKNVAPVVSYRVTTAGEAAGARGSRVGASPAPQGDAASSAQAGAQSSSDSAQEPPPPTGSVWNWFANLPRPVAAALALSVFLILINLFSNPHKIWFHWPVTVLLFIVVLRMVFGRRTLLERRYERRRARREQGGPDS
jgi:adenylate cyclase